MNLSHDEHLTATSRLKSVLPVLEWLRGYRKDWLRPDIVAGLTAAAVVIPKAMAYATIAGLPVQAGLYTVFLPMIIYAVLGTSRTLSVSTTTTLAILVAAELNALVPNGDAAALATACATLTLLVGAILILGSVLRLGFIANFISEPVLIGFKAGIGIVIVVDQVPKLLGIHFPRGNFVHNFQSLFRNLSETSVATLAVGLVMIALLAGIKRFFPRAPAPLIAVAVGICGAVFFRLQARGVELVGHVPKGLPSFVQPNFSLVLKLWPGALGIALMSFTETIAAGRAFVKPDEPLLRANQEMLATGLGNVAGAFSGALAVGGGTTQTAVNCLAGARTQFAELITAAAALVTMLFLSPLIALMPETTLAAVVIVYSIGLIKPREFRAILQIRLTEFFWAVSAVAGVVLLGTLKGILVAIVVSVVALVHQSAHPPVYVLGRKPGSDAFRPRSKEHPDDETFPGLLMLRLEGRIFFFNAEHIAQRIRLLVDSAKPNVVAMDLSGVFDLEYTALKMLIESEEKARQSGVLLWLVGLNPEVLAVVQRSPLGKILERERMHFTLEMALDKYLASLRTGGHAPIGGPST